MQSNYVLFIKRKDYSRPAINVDNLLQPSVSYTHMTSRDYCESMLCTFLNINNGE